MSHSISIAITVVILVFILLCYIVWIVAIWRSDTASSSASSSSSHSSKNRLSKIKLLFYSCGVMCQTFSVFFLYMLAGFYDCSLNEIDRETLERTLSRFAPSVACFGAENLILLVVSIMGTVALMVFVMFSRSITQSLNPLSSVPFTSSHPFTLALLDIVNMLGVVALFAIPMEYGYAAHAVNCVLSFVFLIGLVYTCPFFRRFENSIMCGVACARLGASVATLVTSLIGDQKVSQMDSSLVIGIPLKIGLILLCGVCSFVVYEIYLMITARKVRNRVLSELYDIIPVEQPTMITDKKTMKSFLEAKAVLILQDFNDSNTLRNLSTFFKFAMKSNHVTHLDRITNDEGLPLSISDREICLIFVKTAQNRRFKNVNMLHNLALLIAYDQQQPNVDIPLELMQRISTHSSSVLDQIIAQYRIKEIQHKSASISSESFSVSSDMKVQRLRYLQDLLLSLHRDFWKELIQEPVKYSNVEKITLKISETANECNKLFNELLVHRKNKNHLRMYATFVELFEFDKELAAMIHDEANQLDEEQRVSTSIRKPKKNQVVPKFSKRENSSISNRFMAAASRENIHSLSKKMTSSEIASPQDLGFSKKKEANEDTNDELTEDMNFDDSASVGGFESTPAFEQKKEYLFNNALRTRVYSESILFGAFITFLLCCVAFVIGGVIISVHTVSNITEDVMYLSQVCLPETSPISVMKTVRNMQSWVNIWFNHEKNEWPTQYGKFEMRPKIDVVNSYFDRLKKEKVFFENLIRISGQNKFDLAAYTEYGQTIYYTKIPTTSNNSISSSGDLMFIGEPMLRNVSVNGLANYYIHLIDTLIEQYPIAEMTLLSTQNSDNMTLLRNVMKSPLMNPIYDYTFNYLFQNLDLSFETLNSFCTHFVANSKTSTSALIINVEIYFLIVLCLTFVIGLIFLVMIRWAQLQSKRLVKTIEKQLTKESIGKIYQGLLNSQKTSVDASLDSTFLTKIYKSKLSIAIVVILLSLLVMMCVGIFFYEANFNASQAQVSFVNLAAASNVIAHLQYIGFYMEEVLAFYGQDRNSSAYTFKTSIDHPHLKVAPTIEALQSKLLSEINNLVYNWNDLIFGNINLENDLPIIGLYPSVDKLLQTGVDNCTQYFEQNNLTNTLTNYYRYCVGIQSLMNEYITGVSEVAEITRKYYIAQQAALNTTQLEEKETSIFLKHYTKYCMNLPLTDKLVLFMNEFVRVSSEMKLVMVFSFGVFGILSCFILGKLLHSMMKSGADHFQHTRMLLNYIPVELLDKNEQLRNLALYNQFSNPILDKLNASSSSSSNGSNDENSFTGICHIMNANVDGSLLINTQSEVELINTPALKMFGKTTTETLGASFYTLFAPESQEVIRKVVHSLIEQTTKSPQTTTFHETLEVDACLRSNQSKFPAKINFFTSHISKENRTIIAVTITDITSQRKQQALLAEEKQHSENLLKNILPENVAARLKKGETFIAEALKDITCFFSDMVGFTKISSTMLPTDLVKMLNAIVQGFDELTELYQLEKIKTIGDAYFAVGGINKNCSSDHPERTLRFAQDTFKVIRDFNEGKLCGNILDVESNQQLNIRIGINTGGVVAGVIGSKKFAYDLWGDTINTASRMESTGVPGRIQISRTTYERVHDMGLEFEERQVEVKGKGLMQSYLLLAKHHANPIVEREALEDDDDENQCIDQVMLLRNATSTTLSGLGSSGSLCMDIPPASPSTKSKDSEVRTGAESANREQIPNRDKISCTIVNNLKVVIDIII
ncbi:hypothetical protein C9374_011967 [Naegleria lovaniensis]|uniref:Adenylate and Guanylate cyclase catalytic domain containing protein n=1 Tax=Naegleria lovaniensis TaxID=51637 RepID=A0AA88GF17_NAELO|nr:uncharacterized protein C9374_011967 [Naegleria lovaniensis]KAG2373678.1 hypothetical protein C9374_011967 [Naegleria lovaniensis]